MEVEESLLLETVCHISTYLSHSSNLVTHLLVTFLLVALILLSCLQLALCPRILTLSLHQDKLRDSVRLAALGQIPSQLSLEETGETSLRETAEGLKEK